MEGISEAPAEEPLVDQHPTEKNKVPRKRMRKLFASIREQMEFYFSDSNLRRDRYLRKEIEQNIDGYVPLALFQNFNKMKAICTDPVTIAMALRKCSQVLEVSEDSHRVRRRTPIPTESQADIDNRTVYVECLPQDVNHDWVKNVFSGYGKIAYISLPRWKATGDPKGFAFIEFETADDAQVCCKAFQGSADFGTAHCFPKGSKQLLQLRRRAAVQDVQVQLLTALPAAGEGTVNADEPAAVDKDDEKAGAKLKPKRKRKKAEAVSEEDEDADNGDGEQNASGEVGSQMDGRRAKKRLRKGGGAEPAEEATSSAIPGAAARTVQALDSDRHMPAVAVEPQDSSIADVSQTEHQAGDDTSSDDEAEQGQRSARHRSRKKRKSKKIKAGKIEHLKELDLLKLKVIPKSQWLRLRSEYLNLQKLNVAALKKALQQRAGPAKSSDDTDRRAEGSGSRRGTAVVHAMEGTADGKPSLPSIEFVANVIVKVTCTKGAMAYKSVKASLPPELEVAYIDVTDGSSEGFIRCKTQPSAELLCNSGSIGDLLFTAVRDSEEQAYWDKLRADREQKRSRKQRDGNAAQRKLRGSEKIAAKAEKMTAKTMAAAAGIGASAPGSTATSKLANKHIHF